MNSKDIYKFLNSRSIAKRRAGWIVKPDKWISEPDEDGDGLLRAWVVSGTVEYPILTETHNVSLEDVMLNKEQDFRLVFECAEEPDFRYCLSKEKPELSGIGMHK